MLFGPVAAPQFVRVLVQMFGQRADRVFGVRVGEPGPFAIGPDF